MLILNSIIQKNGTLPFPKMFGLHVSSPFIICWLRIADSYYSAYVSQQNLLSDDENGPVGHPDIEDVFTGLEEGRYQLRPEAFN